MSKYINRLLVCLALLILVVANLYATPPARADNEEMTKILESKYAEITRDFRSKNIDDFSSLLTSDYTSVSPTGATESRAAVIADIKGQMSFLHDVTWERDIVSLTATDDTATATVNGTLNGEPTGKDGKDHAFVLHATTTDTWVQTDDGWKLKTSRVSQFHVTIDGKAVGG